jgi:predicted dehydrogenase
MPDEERCRMKDEIRELTVGVVGLGVMGQNHLRVLSLLKGVSLVWAYDISEERCRSAANLYDVEVPTDLVDVPYVDCIIVCTPSSQHLMTLNLLVSKARAFLIEKPGSSSYEESKSLLSLADLSGLFVRIGYIERFNPAIQELGLVVEGLDVISTSFQRTNKLSQRITDVDVVTDLMVHDIDLAIHLNGPVEAVAAHGVCTIDMIEYAFALLTHVNGRHSQILASRLTEKKQREVSVTSRGAYIECDLLKRELVVHRQSETQLLDKRYSVIATREQVEVKAEEPLLAELRSFFGEVRAGSVTESKSAGSSLAESVEVFRIADEIRSQILSASRK